MSENANYRKLNDGSMSSSTYHKKDGTAVRAMLKADLLKQCKAAANDAASTNELIVAAKHIQ